MDQKVFIYGTLKTCQPNYHVLEELLVNGLLQRVGKAKTVDTYPLVIATSCNLPFMLDAKGIGQRVYGELYEATEASIAFMDSFEMHPDFYLRQKTRVTIVTVGDDDIGQMPITCWTYVLPNFRQHLLDTPMYECYDSKGDHGLVHTVPDFSLGDTGVDQELQQLQSRVMLEVQNRAKQLVNRHM